MNLELQLNPNFTAWDTNVNGMEAWPMRERRHRMTAPDGPDAHDHPFGIEVYIPRCGGGYIEEVFDCQDGVWTSLFYKRRPGESFYIPARRVHRIHKLLAPVVWTYVVTGEFEQDWRVYPEQEIRNASLVR